MRNGRCTLVSGFVLVLMLQITNYVTLVDDGTAVIDCCKRHPVPSLGPSRPISSELASTSKSSAPAAALPEPPAPVAKVGTPVRIVGKIVKRFERQIVIDEIGLSLLLRSFC